MKAKFAFLGGQNAGKTSILRRYFQGTFYAGGRMPTVGADVYSTITYVDGDIDSSKTGKRRQPISIQVWDTPGRERFVNTNGKTRYTASFSDNFLKDLDAVCLVYDVSSSTSFTHVLNWYYELIERTKRMKANHEREKHLPIVIVGNKIDIFQDRDTRQKELFNKKKENVQQRNVLGLTENWRGRDYRYEYSASAPSTTQATTSRKPTKIDSNGDANDEDGKKNRLELLTYLGTNTNYLEAILNNEVYRGSYLDSLLSSEDNSHPDKDMVQLWCMRNGLLHMDVSAKSGAGINDLIYQLIDIAVKQMEEGAAKTTHNDQSNVTTALQRNEELDLHRRYAPKERSCFPFPTPLRSCCKN